MLQLLCEKEVVHLWNSNLHCLKLSEFSILGTLTCILLALIVLVPLLSKLFVKSLNNGTKWFDWKVCNFQNEPNGSIVQNKIQ